MSVALLSLIEIISEASVCRVIGAPRGKPATVPPPIELRSTLTTSLQCRWPGLHLPAQLGEDEELEAWSRWRAAGPARCCVVQYRRAVAEPGDREIDLAGQRAQLAEHRRHRVARHVGAGRAAGR